MLLASCTVVKNYPKQIPFVFANNIIVEGEISGDEKKRLELELQNYWDDSLRVNSFQQFGIRTVIRDPNVFDSTAITRSMEFMNSYLNSEGFFSARVMPAPIAIDTVKEQYRVFVKMNVDVDKRVKIDQYTFDSIADPALRELAVKHDNYSLLEKGKPFTNNLIAAELDRLTTLYRRNGYFRFSRENVYAEVDTTDEALLEITLDPFEQARKVAQAELARRANPTIDVVIKQRPSLDTNAYTQYYIGKKYYYPNTKIDELPDSLMTARFAHVNRSGDFILKQNIRKIKLRPLREHTYLTTGSLYDEENYYKTVNGITQLGPWNQVDIRTELKKDSTNVIDFHFFLTPAPKYSFGYDIEVSRNSGSIITGNLLGINNVLTLRNRNVWRQAIQSATNIRAGVELGFNDTVLQTFQASISQTYSIPRFITPWKIKRVKQLDDYKTVVNLNASYTDRKNFFRLRSAVASWGYEWKKNNHVWLYRPVNIELYSLDTLIGLREAFISNPFLRTAFNTGYVVGQNITYSVIFPSKKHSNIVNNIRLSAEEAGGLLGRLRGLRNKIYQYIKFEGEFRRLIEWRKTSFAYRFFGGIGYNYSSDPTIGQSMPFFKQFVAGGPYSMRAWGVRQLGLGSSLLSDTSSVFRDRFGDIQLETNFEYRFPLTTLGGVKVNSALFVDMGNIWNLKNNIDNPGSKLTLSRLYRDIAIGAGTGLRFDFDYFLIRFDFAYKVKDPARRSNNGWMSIKDFEWQNREYLVKDGSGRVIKRNNFSFQLGIGLPF